MLGYLGLFAGLALLIWFALRGVNIFLASVICALVVAIPNGILLPAALLEHSPFGGLALLLLLAVRGVHILLPSVICALVVAIPNGILLPAALLEHYPFGPLGAYPFAGEFFLLFLCGAIFGKAMATSQAAKSIAVAI